MRKTVLPLMLTVALAAFPVQASAELTEASPSIAAGYYHTEDYDLIMMSNGTAYSLGASETELDGPYEFAVYTDGADILFESEGSYAWLHEQTEKGKTETGGKYYAIYSDYQGLEEEIGYKEGKQTNFEGYIFGNEYDVYERGSLAAFFGVDTSSVTSGRMEGDGYDTPEEALGAYIRAFATNDIDGMIAAFAVETYAENYDLVKMVERLAVYMPSMGYIPSVSEYSIRLNVEKRRSEITSAIRNQYLVLSNSKTVLGDEAGAPVAMNGNYDTAEELVDDLFLNEDTVILSEISFRDEYYDPANLSDIYSSERNQENMMKQITHVNGEALQSVVAKFYVGEDAVLLLADAIKLNGKWYLNSFSGNIGAIMGVSSYVSGMMPMEGFSDEGIAAFLEGEQ